MIVSIYVVYCDQTLFYPRLIDMISGRLSSLINKHFATKGARLDADTIIDNQQLEPAKAVPIRTFLCRHLLRE